MYASLELSKELYELSGWETVENHLLEDIPFPVTMPAYNLDYLLSKLPKENAEGQYLQLRFEDEDYCYAGYYDKRGNSDLKSEAGPTRAVDAAAQLCINLINQGTLPVKEMK